ncbi:hypothetical protein FACS1894211_01250 [Clostridia bacterium]|nr:hypothetical protein FACS1894211_01250 [Clostridia bacterium]
MFFDIRSNKKPKAESVERLKTAMAADDMSCAGRVGGVIRSDFYAMLQNYTDVAPESVRIEIEALANGNYMIRLEAEASRIYSIGIPPLN